LCGDQLLVELKHSSRKMKITGIQAHLLSFPFPEPLRFPYYGGEIEIVKRDALLVRVSTDQGLFGYGPGRAGERSKQAIDRVVAPFLTGRTLSDPDALRILFQQGPGGDAEIGQIYSSVEIALYDLAAKAHSVPVSEMIGGRVRDRIRLYGSGGMYLPSEDCAAEALRVRDAGFGAYKARLGRGPEEDLEVASKMRSAVGLDFDLMLDAQTWWRMGDRSYSKDTVERLAGELDAYRITWLEEPLPPGDHEAYSHLKELDLVPLASGKHEPNELRYLDLIEGGAVDYVQMDVVGQGGYATARRLFPDIARAGLRFAFHSWGTALDAIAAGHLGVCWPESVVRWLEYPCYSMVHPFPLAAEILKQPLTIERGEMVVPNGPGLGVEIDESVIWRYPWIGGPSYICRDPQGRVIS
jgi:L-alanine-DL-glutamate epimerase-like enolase superfamily enzyme